MKIIHLFWAGARELHTFAPLRSQKFSQKSSTFFREWIMNFRFFHFLRRFLHFFCEFLMKFGPDFATNSRKEWRVSLFQSNLRKQIRKLPKIELWNLWKLIIIFHYFSLLFIRVLSTGTGPGGARGGRSGAPRGRPRAPRPTRGCSSARGSRARPARRPMQGNLRGALLKIRLNPSSKSASRCLAILASKERVRSMSK